MSKKILKISLENKKIVSKERIRKHRGSKWMGAVAKLLIASTLINIPAAHAIAFSVTDLGILPDLDNSVPYDINKTGQVVGMAYSVGKPRTAFFWSPSTGMQNLGIPSGGLESAAESINDSGQVAVAVRVAMSLWSTFLWSSSAGMQKFAGELTKQYFCEGGWINNVGQLAGGCWTPNGLLPALWNSSGDIQDLTVLKYNDRILDLNDLGQLIGIRSNNNDAFFWDPTSGIQNLVGLPNGCVPTSLNNNGQVAGFCMNSGGPQAFLWSASIGMQDLGRLPGYSNPTVYDINDSGQVVGIFNNSTSSAPFLWEHGVMIDLSPEVHAAGLLGFTPYRINNVGQIVGQGVVDIGRVHAILLSPTPSPNPVPEPTIYALLLAGLGAMAAELARRHRRGFN